MRNRSAGRLQVIGGLLVALAAVGLSASPGPDPVAPGPMPRVLHGVVAARRHVVVAAPLERSLAEIVVHEGDVVREGDLLARLDDRVARASVALARRQAESRGALRRARLTLDYADSECERVDRLHESQAVSAHDLVVAQHELELARATLQEAEERALVAAARLELEQQILEGHAIRAPFDGRIVKLIAHPGEMLAISAPVLTIVSLQRLEVELHLPLSLYGRLESGRTYELQAEAPVNELLAGTLRTIDPVVDPARGTFRCVFDLENEDETMPVGFSVTLAPAEMARLIAVAR